MKKVYLVVTPFFPHENHFAGSYIYDQVSALMETSDYNVIVVKLLSFYRDRDIQDYKYQGVHVNIFRVLDMPSSILPGLFHSLNIKKFERFLTKKLNINFTDIEIIHSHVIYPAGYLAVSLGKKYSIRNFIQHHGRDVLQLSNGQFLKGIFKKLNDLFIIRRSLNIVNKTDLNIGVSQETLNQLQIIPNFTNKKTYVLYNGVDINKFYPTSTKIKNDTFIIGCIGNFWKSKDQITLIKAVEELLKKIPNVNIKVKFIGTGDTRSECEEYVKARKIDNHFEFLNEVDHTKLNSFYNSLSLFVLPSFDEALGCVYMEALQVGIPIIGVKGQGIEEIIHTEDKKYFLIKAHDYSTLSKNILYFMKNKYTNHNRYDLNIQTFITTFLQDIHNQ